MVDAQAIYRQYKLLCAFKRAMAGFDATTRQVRELGIAFADSTGRIKDLDQALRAIK